VKRNLFKLLRACLGDASAQFSLAADNWLVPPDQRNWKRAVYWARRARRNGDDRAGALLGVIISDPDAPQPAADQEIFSELKGAAEAGDVVGQYNLGWAYEKGFGVPQDLQLALHWYTTAAANGDRDGEAAVARLCASRPGEPGAISVSPLIAESDGR
jgi:TPR repeat protein